MDAVSFSATGAERATIKAIVGRAVKMLHADGHKRVDRMSITMDITATHANGCVLDLARLLAADDFNFCHDVFGISQHIDRRTGKLLNFFSPRFAVRRAEAA